MSEVYPFPEVIRWQQGKRHLFPLLLNGKYPERVLFLCASFTIFSKIYQAIREMGPKSQWIRGHIAEDKIYCEYIAANEEIIREHA